MHQQSLVSVKVEPRSTYVTQKRVSGNQPVFTAIKCISKTFKAFSRSETTDFFALLFCFKQ